MNRFFAICLLCWVGPCPRPWRRRYLEKCLSFPEQAWERRKEHVYGRLEAIGRARLQDGIGNRQPNTSSSKKTATKHSDSANASPTAKAGASKEASKSKPASESSTEAKQDGPRSAVDEEKSGFKSQLYSFDRRRSCILIPKTIPNPPLRWPR